MDPHTPQNTVIYVVANLQGHPWRVQTAEAFINRDKKLTGGKQTVVVYGGNYLDVDGSDISDNLRALSFVIKTRQAWPQSDVIFLSADNETILASRLNKTDELDERIAKTESESPEHSFLETLKDRRDHRNKLLAALLPEHRHFLDSLKPEATLNDYWCGRSAADIPSGKFGIINQELSSGYVPDLEIDHLRFNARIAPTALVLRLEDNQRSLTMIEDEKMFADEDDFFEEVVQSTNTYKFAERPSINLLYGNYVVRTSPVHVPGT